MAISCRKHKERFQSTLLMRGATFFFQSIDFTHIISIHAPHARSDVLRSGDMLADQGISIHAPHARSDMVRYRTMRRSQIFQSTLLMRGATIGFRAA